MKVLLISFIFSSWAGAACLEHSALFENTSSLDFRAAESAIGTFQDIMTSELPEDHHLVIRLEALNPRVNADIVKEDKEIVIQIMGGMLKHSHMKPETLMMLLCHEIGHFLGGPPLKSRSGWSSTEGQADYFTGLKCARLLGFDEATFMDAALALTRIYAQVAQEGPTQLDSCDAKSVERTNYGYPSAQCRLDTLLAGWMEKERPRCWFFRQ